MPPTPNWQPLSMLPTIAKLIDDAVEGTAAHLRNLRAATERPHVLDDATLARLYRLTAEEQELAQVYAQQLLHRCRKSLTPTHCQRPGRR